MPAKPPAVYAVIGNPVAHSLSPLMHTRALAAAGLPGTYVAFTVRDLPAAVSGIRALGIAGVSVTLPHKVAVAALLDQLDPEAARIGAVNTIVARNGRLTGHNTDGRGAVTALERQIRLDRREVILLGAGGAARAIGVACGQAGAHLTVVNRSIGRGRALAEDLNARFQPLEGFRPPEDCILINATRVGMYPDTERTPLPAERLRPGMLVMDAVYTPVDTRLLRAAVERGCRTVDGVHMFVEQGALQFSLWTGRPAPRDVMEQTVRRHLSRGSAAEGSPGRAPSAAALPGAAQEPP